MNTELGAKPAEVALVDQLQPNIDLCTNIGEWEPQGLRGHRPPTT